MEIEFRVLTVAEYPVAEGFKRATVLEVMGDERLFDVWFPAERTHAMFLQKLQAFDPAGCVLVVVDGAVAGHLDMAIRFTEDRPVGHLNNIYLKPEFRRRGLAEVMMAHAYGFFRKHGADWATLKTSPQRPTLVAFYEQHGWRKVGDAEHRMVVMGREI